MKLDRKYRDYLPEYSNYFESALRLFKSMYGMTNYGKLSADELTEWLLEVGFVQYQCHMSGKNIVVLSYVDDCVY